MIIFDKLSGWLFPDKCVLCNRVLEKDETDLCHDCRIHGPQCPVSNSKYPYLKRWMALWYYEDNVRGSLLRFKFHGKRHYAETYGRMLAMRLSREEWTDFDILTWVPISDRRKRKRGYDQVELIANAVAQELGMTAQPCLKKVRDNPAQSGIVGQAERRANVLGVYAAVNEESVKGKRILLLDDIVTTGSTAGECARVLLTAGAKEVNFAVVAAARQHKKGSR